MTLAEMIEDGFPHGTLEGFGRGCRGRICPAPFSCRDVWVRHNWDPNLRAAIAAGESAVAFLTREQEAQQPAPVVKELAAVYAEAAERRRLIEECHRKGWTDPQIAAELGLSLSYVGKARRHLGLALIPAPRGPRKKATA